MIATADGAAGSSGFSLALACKSSGYRGIGAIQAGLHQQRLRIDASGTFTLLRSVDLDRALEIAAFDEPTVPSRP